MIHSFSATLLLLLLLLHHHHIAVAKASPGGAQERVGYKAAEGVGVSCLNRTM
jgi:hypothetical protein